MTMCRLCAIEDAIRSLHFLAADSAERRTVVGELWAATQSKYSHDRHALVCFVEQDHRKHCRAFDSRGLHDYMNCWYDDKKLPQEFRSRCVGCSVLLVGPGPYCEPCVK